MVRIEAAMLETISIWEKMCKFDESQEISCVGGNAAGGSISQHSFACADRGRQVHGRRARPITPAHRAVHVWRSAPGVTVKTLAFNGQVPGPLLRLREGVPVTIDVTNASADPDIVHWHGLAIDSLNDGAMEEGSPMIPAGTDSSLHVHAEALGHALVSHPCVGVRQSCRRHLHRAVRIPAD